MIVFRCESCETPMSATPNEAGERQYCPMCKAIVSVPAESDPDVKPIQLNSTKINKSTYQVVCPKCKGTHNFRESSLGSTTKCRNCGFNISLPNAITTDRGGSGGCLGSLLFLGLGVAVLVKLI